QTRTALHFLSELFASQPALRDTYRREQTAAMTFSPYVPGDGVTAADIEAAFASPGGRARIVVRYVRDFVRASDAGAALAELVAGAPLSAVFPRLSSDAALLALLRSTPVEDWELEQGLTVLRSALLQATDDPASLRLAVALAMQGHLSEFIFEETA